TTPITDLLLSGPLPFVFRRVYSSSLAGTDSGFGFGWTSSLSWSIELRRSSARVHNDQGIFVDFEGPPAVGSEAIGRFGWLLRRTPDGFELEVDDGVVRCFRAQGGGPRHVLTEVRDRAGNTIRLRYDAAGLAGATDSAGREIRFPRNARGRIGAIEVKSAPSQGRWVVFATYEHDESGNLVRVADADGHAWTFTYDDAHRLLSHTNRTGLTFYYRYDREGRAVESWGATPGVDPALDSRVPLTLADGETRAKGIFHVKIEYGPGGYREVIDSRGLKRFFGNDLGLVDKLVDGTSVVESKYDERGFLIAETDAVGATHRYERDARGRIWKKVDPYGRETVLERDASGDVVRAVDPTGAVSQAELDGRRLPVLVRAPDGAVTRFVYDERGQLVERHDPAGAIHRYRRDAQGNVVQHIEPGGATWHYAYDSWGRVLRVTAPTGGSIAYHRSLRGDLLSKTGPDGGTAHYRYDGEGHLIEQTNPAGRSVKLTWGAYHCVASRTDENGHTVRLFYDRECSLTRVLNERGEEHLFERDALGNLRAETTFDGRRLRYSRDAMGRVVRTETPTGATELSLGLLGEILRRTGEDGEVDAFEYDARGLIASVISGAVRLGFDRDARGRIIRETQEVDGEAFTVDVSYEAAGRRVGRRTSLGHTLDLTRDSMGDVRAARLDGGDELTFARDGLGRETMRTLGGGGRIDSAFDIAGRLVRRATSTGMRGRAVGPGEPEWVGPLPESITTDGVYRYDPLGELVESWDLQRGKTRFEHDPAGRLLSALREQGPSEQFGFDETGNLFERSAGGPGREYGPGNRLLRRGDVEYVWDAGGRLAEKRRTLADGAVEVTRYRWNGRGLLDRVETPDGEEISFRYDAFARRVEKRVSRRAAPGKRAELVRVTRFFWDRHVPVHEVTRGAAGSEEAQFERTFVFQDGSFEPLAQRDGHGEWVHAVTDQIGTPTKLVSPRGDVAGELRLSTWGKVLEETGEARTPLRFQGQYADEETGLQYNRHRYYDPEVGRFLSPDPLGLLGGIHDYLRGYDPTIDIDPLGLNRTYPFDIMRHEGDLSLAEQRLKRQMEKARENAPPGTGQCHDNARDFALADPYNRRTISLDAGDELLPLKDGVGPPGGWYNHWASEMRDGRGRRCRSRIIFQDRSQWVGHTVEDPQYLVPPDPFLEPNSHAGSSFDPNSRAYKPGLTT
ncbi:MAG: RHS repeat-associated core domain-containing protein, partial [Polyangiaceae bacterium]